MSPQTPPSSARRHYLWSALLAERAVKQAKAVEGQGAPAVAAVVAIHQVTAAVRAQPVTALMLAEQQIEKDAEALLNGLAFTTQLDTFTEMLGAVEAETEFERLVATLVQDAGRAAESVAVAVTRDIGYVRYLSPPSCARCAILAGRWYRYSDGFLRHPNCDCIHIPTTVANRDFIHDPTDLLEQGQVTGLSKADIRAVADGADLAQVVNVRLKAAGLRTPGRVLARAGRPTPEAIYKVATSRDDAIERLARAGYVRS